jgi:hypothetical protein
MFIHDLVEQQERRLVVIYPGRFQPFHLGHAAVFQQLQGRFGRGNVFVGYSGAPRKKEDPANPKYFDSTQTRAFIHAAGVPDDLIKDISGSGANNMYGAEGWAKVVPFDPATTVVILAIGAPDAGQLELNARYQQHTPTGKVAKLPPGKVVGDEKPLKSLPDNLAECQTSDKFAYVVVVPEVHKQITIGKQPINVSHGKDVRAAWNLVRKKEQSRAEFLTQMFGRNDPELGRILDNIPAETVALKESADDMFAVSNRSKAYPAIKSVLDGFYDHYQALYDQADPEASEEWYIQLGEYLSDYDYLRSELARGGIPGFLNGLDMMSQDTINAIDSELAIKHRVFLNQIEDQNAPLDEEEDDDMFSDKRVSVNPRDLQDICFSLAASYNQNAATADDDDMAELYLDDAAVLEFAARAFTSGLRAGFSALGDIADPNTWEDLEVLAARHKIELSDLLDKYDAGTLSEETDEADMFSSSTKFSRLKKMPTDTLMMLWNAIKDDNRPEYAEVHRQQKVRLGLALAGRGIYVPYPMSGPSVNLDESDEFAPSKRVATNIQRDIHPLRNVGVDYDDYEQLVSMLTHASNLCNLRQNADYECSEFFTEYLGQRMGGYVFDVIERLVSGGAPASGNFIDAIAVALEKEWMQTGEKPAKIVDKLISNLDKAIIATENYLDNESLDETVDDDMFAQSKAQKISQGLRKFAAELQQDFDRAHPTWNDSEFSKVEQEKIKFILFLADNFNNRSKVPYTLNYIARVLNGDSSVVEYYKKHAIWDADDYLKEIMGHGFAELFDEYAGQLDEDDSDMFADSKRVKVTKAIIDDLEYIADQMTYEPEAFLEGRGWEDADVSIDDVQEAGSVFENLANEFKTKGLEGGLAQLFHLYHHTQNQVAEWVTDETIDALSNDYEVDMSRFNLEEDDDDMFAAHSRTSHAVKSNISRKVAATNRAGREADKKLQQIVSLAQKFLGTKYSSGTIGGGKVYRISLYSRGIEGYYHYVPLASVTPRDKALLAADKKRFFDALTANGLDTSRVDIKYHIGATLYTSVRITMKPTEVTESDDMFAERWYDDSKVQKMIQHHFTPTIGTTRAYELGLNWVNLVSNPDAFSRTEMLSMNNDFAEEHDFPFRFKNFKWDGNDGEVYWVLTGGIPLLKEEDDMFSEPRNELGKYIRGGQWASAAIQCIKSGYRNAQVEQSIIPGITRSERSGGVAGGAIWYDVRDWYQKFIAPNDWPELLQYVSSLKAKGPLNSALRHLVNFYANDNQQRTNEIYQLIVDKKAVDALVYFLGWPGNENMKRVPEMEPYIMVSPRAAMYYASNVLNARWPDAEPYIATDKVSWSMYAARALKTDNMTKAGRATRDAAQQEALSRLPTDHKKRIAEEDDDMFAPSWKQTVIQMLHKMLDSAVLQNRFEIEDHDLENIQRLLSALQSGNIYRAKKVWNNFDLDELDNALYLYVVRSHPNIDLYKLLDIEEDDLDEGDDMFASPFRVVHDVVDWQRTAARKFGTRGLLSMRLPDRIIFYVKQEDGAVKGAYYSPQPASDATNIGTYNKNFNGNIEQYMAQDPYNPLNKDQ